MQVSDAIEVAKEELENGTTTNDLEGLVGIDPETGEFDINLVPEEMRETVKRMAQAMSSDGSILHRGKIKGCNRKKKPRVKKPKTWAKNKKRKKKK